MQITRYQSNKRMSQAVVYRGFVFLAGQVADVAGQAAQVLAKIDEHLTAVGSDRTKILSANIWLATYTSYAAINTVWDAWVPEGSAPARACVEGKLAFPEYLIEIGVIAAV